MDWCLNCIVLRGLIRETWQLTRLCLFVIVTQLFAIHRRLQISLKVMERKIGTSVWETSPLTRQWQPPMRMQNSDGSCTRWEAVSGGLFSAHFLVVADSSMSFVCALCLCSFQEEVYGISKEFLQQEEEEDSKANVSSLRVSTHFPAWDSSQATQLIRPYQLTGRHQLIRPGHTNWVRPGHAKWLDQAKVIRPHHRI